MGGGLIDGGFLDGGGGWGAEFGLGTPPGIGILGGVVSFGICAGGRTPVTKQIHTFKQQSSIFTKLIDVLIKKVSLKCKYIQIILQVGYIS